MSISARPFATTWSMSKSAKVVSEYPEVSANLYIRVLQDLERHPEAGADRRSRRAIPKPALKALEKVKQAAPDLYVIALQLSRRWRNRDRQRARRLPRISAAAASSDSSSATPWPAWSARRAAPPRAEAAGQDLHVFSAQRAAWAPRRWPSISPACWRSASSRPCWSIWI